VYGRDSDWRKSTQGEILVFVDDLEALLLVEEAITVVAVAVNVDAVAVNVDSVAVDVEAVAVDVEAVAVDLERDFSLACLRMRRISSRSLLSRRVI
jgi:hypothetical protein